MRLFQATWLLSILLTCFSCCLAELQLVYEWKYIDYVWIDDHQKQDAIACGEYNYTKIVPTDYQPLPDGRALITTPRFYNNPASLSIISSEIGNGGPLLAPFPDWSWHKSGDCSGITSVSKVSLDDYEHLWLVDSGKIENVQVCPAKILKFDVQTEELLLEVEIPYHLTHNPYDETKGLLELQDVEKSDDSDENIWVFIADLAGYGLIIWDGKDMWRLDDEIFYPTVGAEEFSINGENFTLLIGPQNHVITPPGFLEQSYLLFKPISGFTAYAATTDDLHKSKSGRKVAIYMCDLSVPIQEPGKSFAKSNGVYIGSFTTNSAIACWNAQNPLSTDYITFLEANSTTLQYVNSIKITPGNEEGEEILQVMSNRLQKYMLNTMDFTEINFRVLETELNSYVAGTVCEPRTHNISKTIEDKNFSYLKSL